MYWESNSGWIWGIYYLFLLLTSIIAIINIFKNKNKVGSFIAIIFSFTIPIISIINSVGRNEGVNEFKHLLINVKNWEIWAIYLLIGYMYILIYISFIVINFNRRSIRN